MACAAVFLLLGCGTEPTLQEPEGGFLAFRDALMSGHPEAVWETLSVESKDLYTNAMADLELIRLTMTRLSPDDRALVRERTPVRLLTTNHTPYDLFRTLVRLENLAGDDTYTDGASIESIDVDDLEGVAVVTTAVGQEFTLYREDDGVWRVQSLLPIMEERLATFGENLAAVELLASQNAYLRRSHAEIMALLGGETDTESVDSEVAADGSGLGTGVGTGSGTGSGSGEDAAEDGEE